MLSYSLKIFPNYSITISFRLTLKHYIKAELFNTSACGRTLPRQVWVHRGQGRHVEPAGPRVLGHGMVWTEGHHNAGREKSSSIPKENIGGVRGQNPAKPHEWSQGKTTFSLIHKVQVIFCWVLIVMKWMKLLIFLFSARRGSYR